MNILNTIVLNEQSKNTHKPYELLIFNENL